MSPITISIIIIFIGGGLGALCRYGLSVAAQQIFHWQSFWSILCVNLIGCLCIGLISGVFLRWPHETFRLLLMTAFLGAFTTYSTFMLDIVAMVQKNQFSNALIYLFTHIIGGFILCILGLIISKSLLNS